jgi:hypothetical protein
VQELLLDLDPTPMRRQACGLLAGSRRGAHIRRQLFVRDMYQPFGPAHTGLPPHASPQERESWRLANAPETPQTKWPSTAPPGYRVAQYRDGQGLHRSLVPDTKPSTTIHTANTRG